MVIEIAGLGIEINNFNNEFALRRMRDYRPEFGETHLKVKILHNSKILPPQGVALPTCNCRDWTMPNGAVFAAFNRIAGQELCLWLYSLNDACDEITIDVTDVNKILAESSLSNEQVEFYLLGEALRYSFPMLDRMVLHSSALVLDGRGIAFSAPSGTGKSTQASHWMKLFHGCTMINDDAPVILRGKKGLEICGSPWSGKTEINANIKAPLSAIVCLERGNTNEIKRISPGESMPFLLRECRYLPVPVIEKKRLEIIESIVRETKIYLLRCTAEEYAAEICREKIWQEM